MQHDHVLKQLTFDLLTSSSGSGVGAGLQSKHLLSFYCIRDFLYFDMQHDHFQNKNDF